MTSRESICEYCQNSVELEYGTKACKLITRDVGGGRREPCPRFYAAYLANKERDMCPEKKWGPPQPKPVPTPRVNPPPITPAPSLGCRVVSENPAKGYRKVTASNYYLAAKGAQNR